MASPNHSSILDDVHALRGKLVALGIPGISLVAVLGLYKFPPSEMPEGVLVCGLLANILAALFVVNARAVIFWCTLFGLFFFNLGVFITAVIHSLPWEAPHFFWPFIVTLIWVLCEMVSKAADWIELHNKNAAAHNTQMAIRRA